MLLSDFFNLLETGKGVVIAFQGQQHHTFLLHSLDDALLAIGHKALSLNFHLLIAFQCLGIMAIKIGFQTLAEHASALQHLDTVVQCETLEMVKFRFNQLDIILFAHHIQHVEYACHRHIPFLNFHGIVKRQLVVFQGLS